MWQAAFLVLRKKNKLEVCSYGMFICIFLSHDVVICDWGLILLDMPASFMVDLALWWYCAIWHYIDGLILCSWFVCWLIAVSFSRCCQVVLAIILQCLKNPGWSALGGEVFFFTRFKYASSISDLSPFWGFTFAPVLDQCCTYQLVTLLNGVHLLEYYR
jgi:hypothetical protein